jgi:hypothetical protein
MRGWMQYTVAISPGGGDLRLQTLRPSDFRPSDFRPSDFRPSDPQTLRLQSSDFATFRLLPGRVWKRYAKDVNLPDT